VTHPYNFSYSGGRDQEDHSLRPAQANSSRPYLKNTQHKKGRMAQVIEHLPSKCEALNSNPSPSPPKKIYIYIYSTNLTFLKNGKISMTKHNIKLKDLLSNKTKKQTKLTSKQNKVGFSFW
jgi:hypothetical protein